MAENENQDPPENPEEDAGPAALQEGPARADLARALEKLLRQPDPPARRAPMRASELEDALEELRAAGWTFDATGRLRKQDETGRLEHRESLTELQERYPYLPREVAELLFSLLTGHDPDPGIVGSLQEDVRAKLELIQRIVLTEELREEFYLRYCSKVPQYGTLDWEVVIKAVERGHRESPNYPYALLTLAAVDGHNEHESLTFCIGTQGLRRLIEELNELQTRLDEMHQP